MDRQIFTHFLLFFTLLSIFNGVSSATIEKAQSEGPSKSRSRTEEQHHDALIYPTELDKSGPLNRGGDKFDAPLSATDANPSPCPDGAIFCESTEDYPKDLIKSKLKKESKLLLDILNVEDIGTDIHNKFEPESGTEKELCTSVAKVVYPQKAKSKEDKFEFVVNDDEHKQGIKLETCTTNDGECRELPSHVLPFGYRSKCVQKYIVRFLVVLNRNSSEVQGFVTKPFDFPSCCSCVITMSTDRFGGDIDSSPANVTTTTRSSPVNKKPKTMV